jgi:hypothetical protein
MIKARTRQKNTTIWYVFKMPAGWKLDYEIDERDTDAARFGEEVAGPFGGPLGFSRAWETVRELRQKEATDNA